MASKKKKIAKKATTPKVKQHQPITMEKSKYIKELATTKTTAEKKAKAGHYVDNKEMLALIIQRKLDIKEAKKLKLPKPKIPDILGKQILLIAENLSHKPGFHNYPCRDEMIGDAIENCIMYFDNFNPKRSKYPFAYFTTIIYYAFIRRIQKEKKSLYIKYKATQQAGILHEAESGDNEDGTQQFELYDNISEFISKYEEAQGRAKAKATATALSKVPVKKGLEKLFA
jgi:hypothetical protein